MKKYFGFTLIGLCLVASGCTPAQFGFNASSTRTSSLTDPPSGTNNPTLPTGGTTPTGNGGTNPPAGGTCDNNNGHHDSDSDDEDGCKDHDHGKPVEIVPDRPGYCNHPKTPQDVSCDKSDGKKVLICHVPKGSSSHKHTLCIDIHGATNGHGVTIPGSALAANQNAKNKIAHAQDYAGPCR